ncbi:MFS transporter [Phenylobacterium terrae]|uniref:MFS transporter n=1 Tax=Phenylobacterium terrae TaxID=2665495 RepID=A0ABW4N9D7_9CAUL
MTHARLARSPAPILIFGAAVVVATEFVAIGLAPQMASELGVTPTGAGWMMTLFALGSILFGPAAAAGATRLAPHTALALSLLPFAANLLLALFASLPLAMALRLAQGAALPVYVSVAGAVLAARQGAGRGVAQLYIGVTLGGWLAPPLGGLAAEAFGWRAPALALGALSLMAAVCSAFIDAPPVSRRPGGVAALMRTQGFPAQLALSTLLFAAMFAGYAYIATMLRHAGLGAGGTAAGLLLFGLAGFWGNWLGGRLERHTVWGSAGVALAVAVAAAALLAGPGDGPAFAILALWGAAHAAGFVLSQVRVMSAAPAHPDLAGSLNIAAANLGIALGTFTGGFALANAGLAGAGAAVGLFAMATIGLAAVLRRTGDRGSRSAR